VVRKYRLNLSALQKTARFPLKQITDKTEHYFRLFIMQNNIAINLSGQFSTEKESHA